MSKKTKKSGLSAKFGARYGVSVKSRLKTVEMKAKKKYTCPKCSYTSVRRVSAGIWECRHCGLKFTGGAYVPVTQMAGEASMPVTLTVEEVSANV
ncbi:MAG: 50S ribosomal protein L37ae [Candidatus Thermoplasmatota archaeon]|nr:50S ribosomal protein L37ae [archaeon]MBU3901811.1 50S ribosomal protein L37ae [Candidatus Thermoplasmatota archaeon]MBU4189482.1 50S ribosomal protein L37ae [Candidatus Thermoplasmatota archaeon]MBU4255850.1 50S ribosomal protein L37ae [Candidatus Thermoplasmatota archaeon]MCG2826680.1 50S ribosomal protein L37ae [Thermoplasmatales archaeon]